MFDSVKPPSLVASTVSVARPVNVPCPVQPSTVKVFPPPVSVRFAVPMCVKVIVDAGGAPAPVKVRTKLPLLNVKSALSRIGHRIRISRRRGQRAAASPTGNRKGIAAGAIRQTGQSDAAQNQAHRISRVREQRVTLAESASLRSLERVRGRSGQRSDPSPAIDGKGMVEAG